MLHVADNSTARWIKVTIKDFLSKQEQIRQETLVLQKNDNVDTAKRNHLQFCFMKLMRLLAWQVHSCQLTKAFRFSMGIINSLWPYTKFLASASANVICNTNWEKHFAYMISVYVCLVIESNIEANVDRRRKQGWGCLYIFL